MRVLSPLLGLGYDKTIAYVLLMMMTNQQKFKHILASLSLALFTFSQHLYSKDYSAEAIYRPSQLKPSQLAVVYNAEDPNSTEVAQYYIKARNIPEENLIALRFPANTGGTISPEEFVKMKASIDAKLSHHMQAIVLMWKTPYAVACNSITSALTLGYDGKQCQHTCAAGKASPYFNSRSLQPFQDHQLRPSILLPTDNITLAKALIDRGVLSEFSLNEGTGYFLRTSDAARSKPRERFYPNDFGTIQSRKLKFRNIKGDSIHHKRDVMFYFTGVSHVKDLASLNFLPGAVADHLTSFGGIIDKPAQMQSTQWLEAGATGSYGTVTEPCNHWQKFPNPQILISHYIAGETLIEAYWKSVMWPAQGLFIGEPLAKPYGKIDVNYQASEPAETSVPDQISP
jgi:uncharacterized protein (TIGR03790 family)